MTAVLAAIGFLITGFCLGRWRRGLDANRGEAAVRLLLSRDFKSSSYHLLNNVTLPIDGGTTQVDHDAVFKTQRPSEVMPLSDVTSFLGSFETEVLSENRMQFCVGRLECHRRRLSRQTDIEHVNYLTRRFGED